LDVIYAGLDSEEEKIDVKRNVKKGMEVCVKEKGRKEKWNKSKERMTRCPHPSFRTRNCRTTRKIL
jgi:hypothetical protein